MTTAHQKNTESHQAILKSLTEIIGETNGISLCDTIDLLLEHEYQNKNNTSYNLILEFRKLISDFEQSRVGISNLLQHTVSHCLFKFFQNFPLKYNEEHIHLTGALTADFLFPRLQTLFSGPNQSVYAEKIKAVYGEKAWPIKSIQDVDRLIRLKDTEGFSRYLQILYLSKLIFVDRKSHEESAYHIANELYSNYNVGKVRLKFSLSRSSSNPLEQVPGSENVTSEDVILGLFDGFMKFKNENPDFEFVLSPSFRKEASSFDSSKYKSRKEHFEAQVNEIVQILDQNPEVKPYLTDVDTVGNEMDLYRKEHFNEFSKGFRKLQYRGIKIRSHHGETFYTLKKGIQAVDNAMNIWHIDTLEHGLSLGINPNLHFHRMFQRVMKKNSESEPIGEKDTDYKELTELDWGNHRLVLNQLLKGIPLNESERISFIKAKFHTAREVEHYQHDVLNRIIQKGVSLIALPSSNNKLTGRFDDYKDHPFSWWEKKEVDLGVGTDNYITLNTNYIQEMLILLYTDPNHLKITKLLMVCTGETRRPYISHLLWRMRKLVNG